jgi:O-antigen ligase
MPIVSFKYLISRLWFVIPFYFVGVIIFKKYSNIKLFSWLYVIPLLFVIGYTIYNHSLRGFDEESGHWVMTPFYNDHTAYGAILALFIPVFLGFSINSQYKRTYKLFSLIIFIILTVAIILSYSRAAWISLAVALVVYFIILLKIKFRWIFLTIAIIIGLFFSFQNEILDTLERNKQDSSANFVEHIQSISNINTNASNLERINRWQSAIRMFKERPFFGWGPGTYQFFYAPYQLSKEKTIISTNAGDMGNAHSEYIGPLSEMGILGMLSIIAIVVLVIITALKTYKNAENREVKFLSLITLLGLITYFVHGFLNNFLDTDKASVPVWGFIAIIVALNIYHAKKSKNLSSE